MMANYHKLVNVFNRVDVEDALQDGIGAKHAQTVAPSRQYNVEPQHRG